MILQLTLGSDVPKAYSMNNQEQESEVREDLDTILTAMEADGGGIDLVSVDNGIVIVRFKGTCVFCPSIGMTLKFGITRALQDTLPWIKEVIKVQ